MPDSLCAYPWLGAAVRPDGTILPCCKFTHNKEFGNVNNTDPRTSVAWQILKQDMLSGKRVDNCQACYKEEQSGIKSLRQDSLDFFVPSDNSLKKLKQLEVSFNNVCNLACVMCSEEYSTKWQSEKIKHRGLVARGITAHGFDYTSWDLSEVELLKIIGGEPMLSQDKFIDLLNQFNLENLNIMVATNATELPNLKLKTLLERCKKVSYKVSIDGVGPINDWIRWPSKFSEIENNIETLNTWWNNNTRIELQFHTVISIYNVFHLKDIVKYLQSKPNWKLTWNWVTFPHWQSVSILPDKDSLATTLRELGSDYTLHPNPFYVTIDRLNDEPKSTWDVAVEETHRLSEERNMLPPWK